MICTAQLSMGGNPRQFGSEDYRVNVAVALTKFWRRLVPCLHAEDSCSNHHLPFAGQLCVLRLPTAFSKEIFAVATVFVYMCVLHSSLCSTFQNRK